MVDFIKVNIRNCNVPFFETHPKLEFIGSYICKTGEAIPRKKAKYKGLDFILFDTGLLRIQGSIHKYYNDGAHNYNDFSLLNIQRVLNELAEIFNFRLNTAVLSNFEVGLNITLEFMPEVILNNLVDHKNTAFRDVSRIGGYIKQAEHSQYIVKIYDKGIQYNLPYSCLRFELKFTRMQRLNELSIYSLADLMQPKTYQALRGLLLLEWQNCFLFEFPIENKTPLSKRLFQWKDLDYWSNLIKQERYRQRILFKRYIENSTSNIHSIIDEKLDNKFMSLL